MAIPESCLLEPQRSTLVATLERLSGRAAVDEPSHVAEAAALVLWNPATGELHDSSPGRDDPLGLGTFVHRIETSYTERYKGLPPHIG